MKRYLLMLLLSLFTLMSSARSNKFLRVEGQDIICPDGSKLLIKGTNLGNWLNPEGYMFGFSKVNSPRFINEMLSQLVGPDEAAAFWHDFKDSYITREDISFLAKEGANTLRLPFHYKLFTKEDYMGLADNSNEGFRLVDKVVEWCRAEGLYLILDMHDCPGGQTGDNIDDSYGYPWLITERAPQEQFIAIWEKIARHYRNEPVILGYELMNEALATHFNNDYNRLSHLLDTLYKKAAQAVRAVDRNHIILIGGGNWNSRFEFISEWDYDPNLMFTCHRYGGEPTAEAIRHFTETRERTGRPIFMGEIGHGSIEWQTRFSETMESLNMGYTYWPYKKVDGSCMMGVQRPEGWQRIVDFAEANRDNYKSIREARQNLSQAEAISILRQFLANVRYANCKPQTDYIRSMRLKEE